MGLNDTPGADRVHIGFFGRRNAGKSSVVNAVTGQEVALVSAVRGTTTDPVSKAMELLPMGPVMIIDTPGFDDEGALGTERVRRTKQVMNRTDVAVRVPSTDTARVQEVQILALHLLCELVEARVLAADAAPALPVLETPKSRRKPKLEVVS